MTTAKKKRKQEAEAYLEITPPSRTGVKSLGERMAYQNTLLAERPAKVSGGPVVYSDDEKAAARDLLKRVGIDSESLAALDHALMFQERSVRTAAERLGASSARYTARDQFYTGLKNLQIMAERRHTAHGLIAYRKIRANLEAYADALGKAGGETVTIPAALPSDAEASYIK